MVTMTDHAIELLLMSVCAIGGVAIALSAAVKDYPEGDHVVVLCGLFLAFVGVGLFVCVSGDRNT